jgi:SAM-dependent methyltransferase
MQRTFAELYQAEVYPPMSHPSADPAVNAGVARFFGVDVCKVEGARILEIGCGTGHHLLSVASRWPSAECVGVDVSRKYIARAKNLARQAGLKNVSFSEGSILDFQPEAEFDFIIAHGVFSWVSNEVKVGMMDFIGKRLSKDGIAVVSFNVVAGWRERMLVVEKVRVIQEAGGVDEMTALAVFKTVASDRESEIVDDMLAKGEEFLACDDFGPLTDAWSLGAMLKLAELSDLRWLGDSVTGARGDDATDEKLKTTFRSEMFCRSDVSLGESVPIPEQVDENFKVPNFPKLNAWRLVCARECLPLVDPRLKSCVFPFSQIKVLAAMDGSRSLMDLSDYSKEVSPELDFLPWLKYVTERGFFS